jgi:hypothetical protein
MSSLLQGNFSVCDTRLASIAQTANSFKVQYLELKKLREQVRKAELSAWNRLAYTAVDSPIGAWVDSKPSFPI